MQQATRGTFAPAEGDTFTLTLQDVAPRAVYFSDRPDRVAGSLGNETLAGLEVLFDPDDPPNAALVISAPASEDENVVILSLANPRFDQEANHFTYDATMVDEVSEGLHVWDEHHDASVPGEFGHVTLFIDSTVTTCPGQVNWDNGTVNVTVTDADDGQPLEGAQVQLYGTGTTTPDYSGTTDATGSISLSVIPSNALVQDYWRTTVEQPGYVTLQQDVTVCPDQVVDVTADLDPE